MVETQRVPFPSQPEGVAWPTRAWPTGRVADDVDTATLHRTLDLLFERPGELGLTQALVVIHRGKLVVDRYAEGIDANKTLISWSMAKSMTHALVGFLVGEGRLQLAAPAPVAAWADDNRREITLQHLLDMRDGLDFVEDYVDGEISHVIDMLFGAGQHDHAAYAMARPLGHSPGAVWNYSSGTTNIVARIVANEVGGTGASDGGRAALERFLHDRLFGAIGMHSAVPKFDDAGTFVGSSYVYATAQDFARFGYLYLRDGIWDEKRVLPEGWADHGRTLTHADPVEPAYYGSHWWHWNGEPGSMAAHGYEGQYTVVLPERDLVLVRLGKTLAELRPNLSARLREIVEAFPRITR